MASGDSKFAQPIRVATIKDPTGTGTITVNTSGAITMPNATDTLVGKATTDTLTNKTLTSPTITGATGITKSDVGLGNVDNTSDATKNAAAVTLTNKTLTSPSMTSPSVTSGNLAMGGGKVTGMGAPTTNGDALRFDQLGANSGIATLDSGGKIPVAQLPNSIMDYLGTWAASTNTPTLADGVGSAGDVYVASDAGTVNFGSGNITFVAGDWVVYSGTVWQKSINSNSVASVNGQTGAVTINAINQLTGDVTATVASGSQSKATTVAAIQGTTVSGTTGTGNVVFSASPTFTGTIIAAAATLSGAFSASNVSGTTSGTNTGDQTITLTGDVTGTGTGSFATTIANLAVTNAKIANATIDLTAKVTGVLPVANGGTGQSTYTNGQLLIGNTTGNTLTKATLTAGTGISITNGTGTITIASTAPAASAGDIAETSFTLASAQTNANVTGLAFANGTVRSFQALVSVVVDSTYEVFELTGIQKGASWDMSYSSTGDTSGISFTITNAGQVQYSSGTLTTGTSRFRAITTSV